jgi:IKAROS family zinc finger protein
MLQVKKEKNSSSSNSSSSSSSKPLPFMCPVCKKRFQRHIALNAHFQNEHISGPGPNGAERTCRLCGSAFPSLGAVRHHLVAAHNIHLDSPTKCLDEAYRPPHAAAPTAATVPPAAKYSVLEASLRSGGLGSGGSSSSSSSSSEASNGSESSEPSCSNLEMFSGGGGGGSGRSSPQQSDFGSGCHVAIRRALSPARLLPAVAACSSTERSPERASLSLLLRQTSVGGPPGMDHEGSVNPNQTCDDDDDDVHVEDLSIRRSAPVSSQAVAPPPLSMSRRYSPAPAPSRSSPPPLRQDSPSGGHSSRPCNDNKKRARTSSTSDGDYSPIPPLVSVAAAAMVQSAVSGGGKFTCSPCSIVFPNQTLYFLHRGFHSEANPWRCNACGHLSSDLYDFNTHLYSVAHL